MDSKQQEDYLAALAKVNYYRQQNTLQNQQNILCTISPNDLSYSYSQSQAETQNLAQNEENNGHIIEEEEDGFDENTETAFVSNSINILNSLRQQSSVQSDVELQKEIFIELVRSFPCIWDMRSSLYKDSTKKKLAWHQIYKALDEKYESKYSLYGCHIYA